MLENLETFISENTISHTHLLFTDYYQLINNILNASIM